MASFICRLAAKDWDQLRNCTTVLSMGLPYAARSTGKHVFSLIVAQLGLKLELVLRLVLLSKYDVVHFFINCKYLLLNCITDYYVLFCKD